MDVEKMESKANILQYTPATGTPGKISYVITVSDGQETTVAADIVDDANSIVVSVFTDDLSKVPGLLKMAKHGINDRFKGQGRKPKHERNKTSGNTGRTAGR